MNEKKYTASDITRIKARLKKRGWENDFNLAVGKSRMVLLDEIIKRINPKYSILEIQKQLQPRK